MREPLSNKPKITNQDILRGYVNRYFVQNISTKVIIEIDQKQYELFKREPNYVSVELRWVISGNATDTMNGDGSVINYGAIHRNKTLVEWYSKGMPGLIRMLPNPIEYFQGTF